MNSKDWKAKLAKQREREIRRQRKLKEVHGDLYSHPQKDEFKKARNQDDRY